MVLDIMSVENSYCVILVMIILVGPSLFLLVTVDTMKECTIERINLGVDEFQNLMMKGFYDGQFFSSSAALRQFPRNFHFPLLPTTYYLRPSTLGGQCKTSSLGIFLFVDSSAQGLIDLLHDHAFLHHLKFADPFI